MKKITVLFIMFLLTISLAACSCDKKESLKEETKKCENVCLEKNDENNVNEDVVAQD